MLNRQPSPKVSFGLLVLAILTFNNWFLGLFFNSSLLDQGGEISELSVHGQPYAWLFRLLDIVSGLLLVWVALIIWQRLAKAASARKIIVISLIVLAVANIFDALFPLKCSEIINRNCQIPVQIGLHHFDFPLHGYSSVAFALSYMILPLGGWLLARRLQATRLRLASIITIGAGVYVNSIFLIRFIFYDTYRTPTWGISQPVQMLLLSTWLAILLQIIFEAKINS